jgi:hypothetical protein
MERAISSAGWLVAGLLHIFQFATQASVMTGPFRTVTFAGTDGTASPSVQTTKCYTPPNRARQQPAPLPRLQIRLQCFCKMRCCPNMAARQVPRDVHKDARDMARRRMGTKRFSYREMNASALRCALLISRPTTVSNVCGSEVSPAPATSFTLPPS